MQRWLFYFFSNTSWGLSQPAVVGLLDPRHVMIHLSSHEDMVKAWTRESHIIDSSLFRLFRWSPDFHPRYESSLSAVWIRLPYLPLPFLRHTLKVLWEPLDDSFVQMIALLPWLIPCLLVYVLRWMSLSLCLLGFGLVHPKKNEFSLSRKEYRMTRDSIPYQS